MLTNPLTHLKNNLPQFNKIKNEHMFSAINNLIAQAKNGIDQISQTAEIHCTWDSIQLPLDKLLLPLEEAWSIINHLNSVMDTQELRAIYKQCLPVITEFYTWLEQHTLLYNSYQHLWNNQKDKLSVTQKRVIKLIIRDFKLAGVNLEPRQKEKFTQLQLQLAEYSQQFGENVLDATQAWKKWIQDESILAGLPAHIVVAAKEKAQNENYPSGWLIGLDAPTYIAVMTYAHDRHLREEMYKAYVTKASDQSNEKQYDNTPIIKKILQTRQQLAQLLGYSNYGQYALETRMAASVEQVLHFLNDLASKAYASAQKEINDLTIFAKQKCDIQYLKAWDVAYCSEKLRQNDYDFSSESLRPWFTMENCLSSLFFIVKQLFNIDIKPAQAATWHPQVTYYELYRQDKKIAGFFLDPYWREGKRAGAWMDECKVRHQWEDTLQLPVSYLICNFTQPINGQPTLLTHDEVLTLFHEFGHGLHHMLTVINHQSISGIRNVAWDAVELPSQLLENWCWSVEGIQLIAKHYETGETLPEEKITALLNSRCFQSAMSLLRQVEYALIDFQLHTESQADTRIRNIIDEVRQKVSVFQLPDFNRFENSFSHIFAGGYAAGYYSYKWAEVLAADAFTRFEIEGLLNQETGLSLLNELLSQGGLYPAQTLFKKFMGRDPDVTALLKQSNIITE